MAEIVLLIIASVIVMYASKSFFAYQQESSNTPIDVDVVEIGSNSEISESEAGLIVALLAKVSSLDNHTSEFEKVFVKNTLFELAYAFNNHKEMLDILSDIYDSESKNSDNLEEYAHQYYQTTSADEKKRVDTLYYILTLLFIEGSFDEYKDRVDAIVSTFRISPIEYNNIVEYFREYFEKAEDISEDRAIDTLELKQNASKETIEGRFRELLKDVHPNFLDNRIFDNMYVNVYVAKLDKINRAFLKLNKPLGIEE